ncbi:protein FAM133-like [Salvia splendens]|uniref:protein FAM133-like n=1 Tax=Salvia splendens TaxID=180675 RepID=UPI001C27B8CC|nr:protein FAM133-like [Salvia splendens]
MGKEKKKIKKSKGAKDVEADMKSGSRKGELSVVYGGDRLKSDNAERNGESFIGLTVDHSGMKSGRREKKKDKNEIVETHDTDEVKREGSINWQEGVNVSGKVRGKEVLKEKIKQKVKRTDSEVGEKDGELILEHSESCIASATEIREDMKKDKKKEEGCQFCQRQENVLYDVEDHTQSTKEDGGTKNNHEVKKKKKHKKKENYKDDLPAAQQKYVDSDSNSGLNTKEIPNNEAAEFTIKRKKRKSKVLENCSSDERDNEAEYAKKGKRRKTSLVVKGSVDTSPNKVIRKLDFLIGLRYLLSLLNQILRMVMERRTIW